MKNIFTFLIALMQFFSAFSSDAAAAEKKITLPVIMYHHISEKESLLGKYVITPSEFESDIKFLKENGYNSVLPSEIESGNIPEKPVMITFDDGFLSTYKYALPILQKYSMKGVCAVVGSLMKEYTDNPNTVSDCAYMDNETVKALGESGVFEIACHTYNMHSTTARKGCSKMKNESSAEYRALLMQDLTKFNNLYSEVMDTNTDIIAFPYGEYSSETVAIAADSGYRICFTCDEKINRISKNDEYPIVLGRFNRPHGVTTEEFFGKINSSASLSVIGEKLLHTTAGVCQDIN